MARRGSLVDVVAELESAAAEVVAQKKEQRAQFRKLAERERVAIKLVALERAKVEELKKRLTTESEFAKKAEEIHSLKDEIVALKKQLEEARRETKQKVAEVTAAKNAEIEELRVRIREGDSSSVSGEEKLRRAVLGEIGKTERDYYEDLLLMRSVFEQLAQVDASLVPGDEVAVMISASSRLLEALSRDGNGEHVSAHFSEFIRLSLTAYSDYCAGAFSRLTKAMIRNSKPLANFRKKVEADHRLRGLPLEALFIKPVQRICRYPLLLAELKKRTPDQFPNRDKLEAVVDRIQEAVTTINDIRRESEMTNRALELQRIGIEGLAEFEFVDKNRRLLREIEGEVSVSSKGTVTTHALACCWMFTDCVVFVSQKKNRRGFRLVGVCHFDANLLCHPFRLNTASSHLLEFAEDPTQSYLVRFPSESEMLAWQEAISNIVVVETNTVSRLRTRQEAHRSLPPGSLHPGPRSPRYESVSPPTKKAPPAVQHEDAGVIPDSEFFKF